MTVNPSPNRDFESLANHFAIGIAASFHAQRALSCRVRPRAIPLLGKALGVPRIHQLLGGVLLALGSEIARQASVEIRIKDQCRHFAHQVEGVANQIDRLAKVT